MGFPALLHLISTAQLLTSTCDRASAPVILLLPVLEVLVSSEGVLSRLGIGLGPAPQHKGGALPEGGLARPKPTLALIAQLVEEALHTTVRGLRGKNKDMGHR